MSIFGTIIAGKRVKEPRSYEMVSLALQGVAPFRGHRNYGPFTAYDAAKAWGVSPHTARRWLSKWVRQGMLTFTTEQHRPGVEKRVYRVVLSWFPENARFHFGTVRANRFWVEDESGPVFTFVRSK